MRYVPVSCLREGMKVAKTIYGQNNSMLLACNVILSKKYIDRLKLMKYPGIYIEDDLSVDIDVVNVISDNLRMETMAGIKKMFISAEHDGKPLVKEEAIRDQVEDIVEELLSNSGMMVNMIDLKCFDDYTYSHSVNVAVLSIIIGIELDLKRDMLIKLGLGALMHDIGKVFIDKKIINKPGKLTDEEFDEIKKHPTLGYNYVKEKYKLPYISNEAIIDHHEKYDGSGYPSGKIKEKISLFGRIITVSDIYDALSSERPYRKAMTPSEAMEYIMGGSGSLFDPKIVNVFTRKVAPYPVGTTVNLSNNWVGIVTENFESFCLRPNVRIIKQDGKMIKPFEISLKGDFDYFSVTVEGIANE